MKTTVVVKARVRVVIVMAVRERVVTATAAREVRAEMDHMMEVREVERVRVVIVTIVKSDKPHTVEQEKVHVINLDPNRIRGVIVKSRPHTVELEKGHMRATPFMQLMRKLQNLEEAVVALVLGEEVVLEEVDPAPEGVVALVPVEVGAWTVNPESPETVVLVEAVPVVHVSHVGVEAALVLVEGF